jgi:uncharacterized membrane protein YedE/YeeE
MPGWAIACAGFLIGFAAGYAVHRGRLCSFGAIEDALIGRDWRRMKTFAFALGIALAGTQAMVVMGVFDPSQSTYVPARVAVLSAVIGSVLFGIGMAFVGTCAFGSLVRLGGGDLRSLISMLLFGVVAYATLRGVLSLLRVDLLERVAVAMPGGTPSDVGSLLSRMVQANVHVALAAVLAAILILWALFDARLRKSKRLLLAGGILGLGVFAGWAITGPLADPFDENIRVRSLTFVGPVARALFGVIGNHADWLDFGAMSVPGVVAGSFVYAKQSDNFRWEAYDDHHEMRRHLTGAALMGFGGVLAGGCTIGQGLTAGSVLSVTWPVTVLGMIAGARLGIAILVEGSVIEFLRQRLFATRGAE